MALILHVPPALLDIKREREVQEFLQLSLSVASSLGGGSDDLF